MAGVPADWLDDVALSCQPVGGCYGVSEDDDDEMPFGDFEDDVQVASAAFTTEPPTVASCVQQEPLPAVIDNVLRDIFDQPDFPHEVAQSVLALKPRFVGNLRGLAAALAELYPSYHVHVRETRRRSRAVGQCLKRLHHTHIVLRPPQSSAAAPMATPMPLADPTLVVEPAFRDALCIHSPCPRYQAIQNRLPDVFVAYAADFAATIDFLAAEMAASFRSQSRELPPWRTRQALASKWDASLAYDTPVNTPAIDPPAQPLAPSALVGPAARVPFLNFAHPPARSPTPMPPTPTPNQPCLLPATPLPHPATDPFNPQTFASSALAPQPRASSSTPIPVPGRALPWELPRSLFQLVPDTPPQAPQPAATPPAPPAPPPPPAPLLSSVESPPTPPVSTPVTSQPLPTPYPFPSPPSTSTAQPLPPNPLHPHNPPPSLTPAAAFPPALPPPTPTQLGATGAATTPLVNTPWTTSITTTTTTTTTTRLTKRGSRRTTTVTTTTTQAHAPCLPSTTAAALAGAVAGVLVAGRLPAAADATATRPPAQAAAGLSARAAGQWLATPGRPAATPASSADKHPAAAGEEPAASEGAPTVAAAAPAPAAAAAAPTQPTAPQAAAAARRPSLVARAASDAATGAPIPAAAAPTGRPLARPPSLVSLAAAADEAPAACLAAAAAPAPRPLTLLAPPPVAATAAAGPPSAPAKAAPCRGSLVTLAAPGAPAPGRGAQGKAAGLRCSGLAAAMAQQPPPGVTYTATSAGPRLVSKGAPSLKAHLGAKAPAGRAAAHRC